MELIAEAGVTPKLSGSPWVRSWWDDKGKAVPTKATSLQAHCRVEASQRDEILKVSGLGGAYISPKTEKGSIDSQFAVIWLEQTLMQMKVTVSTLPQALGLIRIFRKQSGKISRGIRVSAQHYEAAFKQLKPTVAVPRHIQVQYFAKLEPTPVGANQDSLREWLESVSLQARPIATRPG